MSSRAVVGTCLAILCTGLTSCGYTTGLKLKSEYDSIGIQVFDNDTPQPDLELALHVAMTRTLRNLVDVPLLAPDEAHVVVRGRLTRYRRRDGLRTKDDVWVESGVLLDAEAGLWDTRKNERAGLPVFADSSVGYTLSAAENELEARQHAVENLAERLILELLLHRQAPVQPQDPQGLH